MSASITLSLLCTLVCLPPWDMNLAQHDQHAHRFGLVDFLAVVANAKESISLGGIQQQQHTSSCSKRLTPAGSRGLEASACVLILMC